MACDNCAPLVEENARLRKLEYSAYCVHEVEKLQARIQKLEAALEVARDGLEFCRDYDRSKEPDYGEIVRGHKPGPGQRFLTPKEKARFAIADLDKILRTSTCECHGTTTCGAAKNPGEK